MTLESKASFAAVEAPGILATAPRESTSESIRKGDSMSFGGAQAPDAEMERQWRIWKAKGVKLDRRRAVVIGRVCWVVGIAMTCWLLALVI